jgi:hypothetical protein
LLCVVLVLVTGGLSFQLHTLAALTTEEIGPKQRFGGFQSRSGHCGKVNGLLPLPEIEKQFFGLLARSLVTLPTELS